MPITPDDLLSLADTLLGEPAEVCQRAAASRAYDADDQLSVAGGNAIRTDAKEPRGSQGRRREGKRGGEEKERRGKKGGGKTGEKGGRGRRR